MAVSSFCGTNFFSGTATECKVNPFGCPSLVCLEVLDVDKGPLQESLKVLSRHVAFRAHVKLQLAFSLPPRSIFFWKDQEMRGESLPILVEYTSSSTLFQLVS